MRRLGTMVIAVCAAILMVLTVTACNKQEESGNLNVEGSWKRALNEDDYHGPNADFYGNYLNNLPAQDVVLNFGSEGKATVSAKVDGETKTAEATYTADKETVVIADDSGYITGAAGSYTLTMKNEKLIVTTEGKDYICFIRQ